MNEIDQQCQEKAIALMKAIIRTTSIQIYVTTRSHNVDNLQFQLSQFAYTLDNFNKEDQKMYLTSFWKGHFDGGDDQEQDPLTKEENAALLQFADALIDRISTSLKDPDGQSFIGIPLQCRILAECFQSKVQDALKQNKLDSLQSNSLFQTINDHVSIYEMYRILIREKTNLIASPSGKKNNAALAQQLLMKFVNSYHFKLAIETVFYNDMKHADLLWPLQQFPHRYQSEAEKDEEKEIKAQISLNFGLTNTNGPNNQIQFFHLTLAEYFVAKFLTCAFHPDDKRHNNLLYSQPVRELFVNQILAKPEFDGVRIFLEPMLKEIVESDEWRSAIPKILERFEKFSITLYRQMSVPKNVLAIALRENRISVFRLVLDCLSVTLDRTQILECIEPVIISYLKLDVGALNNEAFQQCINCYENANSDEVKTIVDSVIKLLPPCGMDYTFWDPPEKQNMVERILEFLTKHQDVLYLPGEATSHFDKWRQATGFFVFHKFYYEAHAKVFIQLVSRVYSDDLEFTDLLKKSLNKQRWNDGRIENALLTLVDLDRPAIWNALTRLVLSMEPKAVEKFYAPSEPELRASIDDIMKRDSIGMTSLHRAAFHGDTEILKALLSVVERNKLSTNQEEARLAKNLINLMAREEEGFTPLYVLATHGNMLDELRVRSVLDTVLSFLKRNLSEESFKNYLVDKDGFLSGALRHCIECNQIKTLELILKSVKISLGQNYLLDLLKSIIASFVNKDDNFVPLKFSAARTKRDLIETLTKVYIQEPTGYEELNNLFFTNNRKAMELLVHVEAKILQGMFSSMGSHEWVKMFLDGGADIREGFQMLSHHLDKLTRDQLKELVHEIISDNGYWARCFDGTQKINAKQSKVPLEWTMLSLLRNPMKIAESFTKCLVKLGDDEAKQLIYLHDHGQIITLATFWGGQRLFNSMLACLPEEDRNAAKESVKKNAPQIVQQALVPDFWMEFNPVLWMNMLQFAVDHVNNEEVVHTFLAAIKTLSVNGQSVWVSFFDKPHYKADKEIEEFLTGVTKRLGEDAARDLLLHSESKSSIIFRIVTSIGGKKLGHALMHLISSKENRHSISQSLSQIPPSPARIISRDWMTIFSFLLEIENDKQIITGFFEEIIKPSRDIDGARCSIWGHYANVSSGVSAEELSQVLKSVKEKLGQDEVENLLFHDDGNGVVIVRALFKINKIQSMYCNLSQENRNHLDRKLLDIQGIADKILSGPSQYLDCWVKHYLGVDSGGKANSVVHGFSVLAEQFLPKFSRDQLNEFFKMILSVKRLNRNIRQGYSIWANYIDTVCCTGSDAAANVMEVIEILLSCVSEKLGPLAVKELVLHDDGRGENVIMTAASKRRETEQEIVIVEIMLNHLIDGDREEIRQIVTTSPGNSENVLNIKQVEYLVRRYIGTDYRVMVNNFLDAFLHTSFPSDLDKFNALQLRHFIEIITLVKKHDWKTRCSIWGEFLNRAFAKSQSKSPPMLIYPELTKAMKTFMKCVSEKLDRQSVLHLVLHNDSNGVAILRRGFLLQEDEEDTMLEAMLACLNDKDREEIHKVISDVRSIKKTSFYSSSVVDLSNRYQELLRNIHGQYKDEITHQLMEKMEPILDKTGVLHITSTSPESTAVKVITVLDTLPDYKRSYLVLPWNEPWKWPASTDIKELIKSEEFEGETYQIVIAVCGNDTEKQLLHGLYCTMILQDQEKRRK